MAVAVVERRFIAFTSLNLQSTFPQHQFMFLQHQSMSPPLRSMFLTQLLQLAWRQLPLFFLLPLMCLQPEPSPPSTLWIQLSPTLMRTQTESFPPSPLCLQQAEVQQAVSATSTLAISTPVSSPDYWARGHYYWIGLVGAKATRQPMQLWILLPINQFYSLLSFCFIVKF